MCPRRRERSSASATARADLRGLLFGRRDLGVLGVFLEQLERDLQRLARLLAQLLVVLDLLVRLDGALLVLRGRRLRLVELLLQLVPLFGEQVFFAGQRGGVGPQRLELAAQPVELGLRALVIGARRGGIALVLVGLRAGRRQLGLLLLQLLGVHLARAGELGLQLVCAILVLLSLGD